MPEHVQSSDVWKQIRLHEPELSYSTIARRLGMDESNVRRYQQSKRMRFDTADRLLTSLHLQHLLSDGTIPVETTRKPSTSEKIKRLRANRDLWKERALSLGWKEERPTLAPVWRREGSHKPIESRVQSPSLSPKCSEDVRHQGASEEM